MNTFVENKAFSTLYRNILGRDLAVDGFKARLRTSNANHLTTDEIFFLKKYKSQKMRGVSRFEREEIQTILNQRYNRGILTDGDQFHNTYKQFVLEHGTDWQNRYNYRAGAADDLDDTVDIGLINDYLVVPPGKTITSYDPALNQHIRRNMHENGRLGGISPVNWRNMNTAAREEATTAWIAASHMRLAARKSRRLTQIGVGGGVLFGGAGLVFAIDRAFSDAPADTPTTPASIPTSPPAYTESARGTHAFSLADSKNDQLRDECKTRANTSGCLTNECTILPNDQQIYGETDNKKGCNKICDSIHAICHTNIGLNRARMLADEEKTDIPDYKKEDSAASQSYWPSMKLVDDTNVNFPQFTKWENEYSWPGCGLWYLDPSTNKPKNWDDILLSKQNAAVNYSKNININKSHLDGLKNELVANNNNDNDYFGTDGCISKCKDSNCPADCVSRGHGAGELCFESCGKFGKNQCTANSKCKWNTSAGCWPNRNVYEVSDSSKFYCNSKTTQSECETNKNPSDVPWCKYDQDGFCGTSSCSVFKSKPHCNSADPVSICVTKDYDNYENTNAEHTLCDREQKAKSCGTSKIPMCGHTSNAYANNQCKLLNPYTECNESKIQTPQGDALPCHVLPTNTRPLCGEEILPTGGGVANCRWDVTTETCSKF